MLLSCLRKSFNGFGVTSRGIEPESFWMGGPRACRETVYEDDALKD